MTTVYVTHDQREALTLSDRVAVIDHGRIIQLDEPRQIYDQPANAFVANFIGESTLIPIQYADGRPCYAGVPLRISEQSPARGELLMLRPERLTLFPDSGDNYNLFIGTVRDVVYQGESFITYVTLSDGTEISMRGVSQRETLAAIPPPGREITLGLHADETVLIHDQEPSA